MRETMRVNAGSGANREAMRRHNLGTLLRHVHREGQLSRAVLTARMNLTRSTIGELIAELEKLGAVVVGPADEVHSTAGRPSPVVRPVPANMFVLAAEVGTDRQRVAVVGLGGEVLARVEGKTPGSRAPADVADTLIDLASQAMAGLPGSGALLGLGVAVPGMVGGDGIVHLAPHLGWTRVPLVTLLKDRLQARLQIAVPIVVANDADLGALAEHTRGAGVGANHMVFVGCDDLGVGGGIIIDGHAFRGARGFAGEFGHMVVNPHGRQCHCGSSGCWETEIGAARVAAVLGLPGSEPEELARALGGVRRPSRDLRTIGRFLGLGLANVVNAFNIELIVLGGTLRSLYPVVQAETDAALQRSTLVVSRSDVRLVLSRLGDDAALFGAAEIAMEPLFRDPVGALTAAADRAVRRRRREKGARSPNGRGASSRPSIPSSRPLNE